MRRSLLGVLATLALVVFTSLPVLSAPVVEELVVRRQGDRVNVRVVLRNPSSVRQPGPIVIELFARRDASAAWEKVKTWKDIPYLQPGYKVARDIFQDNSPVLQALSQGTFEVRAVVKAPGLKTDIEKTSQYNTPDY